MQLKAIYLATIVFAACACAQSVTENTSTPLTRDGKEVSRIYGGVHNPYPDLVPAAPKAPKGYEVCYLSHYGRHGSRYIHKEEQYNIIRDALQNGHDAGNLTTEGEDVFERFMRVYPELKGRAGELTAIGQKQHAAIAERMVRNYPGLFRKGNKVIVRSTNLERTLLSMNAALNRICELRRGIDFDIDGSVTDVGYLNPQSSSNPLYSKEDMIWRSEEGAWNGPLDDYTREKLDVEEWASRLFCDLDAVGCDLLQLEKQMFYYSIHLQGCPVEQVGFFDLFTEDELMVLGHVEPSGFYYQKGGYPSPLARGDESAEALLTEFIEKTDADLAAGVSARLRFGHDGCMATLWSLMKVPGWDQEVSSLDEVWNVWTDEELPMAANIQMVFYRPRRGQGDLLFRYIVNEQIWELPLQESEAGRQIYRWSDFVEKYVPVAAAAHAIMAGL